MGGKGDVHVEHGPVADQGAVFQMPVDADALTKALGKHLLRFHIDKLILKRGAAGVDDQNLHDSTIPFYCKLDGWNVEYK
jgi:hypothetical protein